MPNSPLLACRNKTCPNLVPRGEGWCPIHKKQHHRDLDQDRLSSSKRGYGTEWRIYRIDYLMRHPLCVQCEVEGRIEGSTVVDHIKDHGGDYNLFWDPDNHQGLCGKCHNVKTATEHLVKKN